MAKRKKQTADVNKSDWFRTYFREHEDEARESNLDNVQESWKAAFPDIPWDQRVTQSMHAARSAIRKELGIKGRKRGGRKRKGARATAKAGTTTRRSTSSGVLKELESRLDDCIMTALKNDNEGLKPVVDSLRQARLAVIKTMIGA